MPTWKDGLVDAFPVPVDNLENLKIADGKEEAEILKEASTAPNPNPFAYFDLPAELRNRIYNLVLYSKPGYRRRNGRRRGSRLAIMLVSKRFHQEVAYILYTTEKFLVFPLQIFNPPPMIQELPLHYRRIVTNLEMRVGSSWTNPPKSWRVTPALTRCLRNLKSVQTLRIFVEFDPSHPAFNMHRKSLDFYTDFCGDLLEDVLDAMPQLKYVQLDGNLSVDVHGPLVSRLREEALDQGKLVKWGKEASWAHKASDVVVVEPDVTEELQ